VQLFLFALRTTIAACHCSRCCSLSQRFWYRLALLALEAAWGTKLLRIGIRATLVSLDFFLIIVEPGRTRFVTVAAASSLAELFWNVSGRGCGFFRRALCVSGGEIAFTDWTASGEFCKASAQPASLAAPGRCRTTHRSRPALIFSKPAPPHAAAGVVALFSELCMALQPSA